MVNWFTHPNVSECSDNIIDLVAYRNHMRWLKTCSDNLPADMRDWKTSFAPHLSHYIIEGWQPKLGNQERNADLSMIMPCRACKKVIKCNSVPGGFYGGKENAPRWNQANGTEDPRDLEWPTGTLADRVPFPLLSMDWRFRHDPSPIAYEFLSMADNEFNPGLVTRVAEVGDRIVREHKGEIRLAARQVQEIEMRKMNDQVLAAQELLGFDTDLRNQISQLHTIGALPHFHGQPPEGSRRSGLPYEETKTVGMVEKIWKDVRQGRVLVITSRVAGPESLLIATPTTTAVKKLPDRSISKDFRIISDLRYTNLFRMKSEYPDVQVTDIIQLAERAVSVKRKWSGLLSRCTKRDIDSAFKRIRVHTDMSLILCAEFRERFFTAARTGEEKETEESIIFLYLVLPFGWRASPGYFSLVGNAITRAHAEFGPRNRKKMEMNISNRTSLLMTPSSLNR